MLQTEVNVALDHGVIVDYVVNDDDDDCFVVVVVV